MKSSKIFIIIISVLAFNSSFAQSAGSSIGAISWEIAFPEGNSNFLDKTSFAGGRAEYRHMFRDNLSVGLALSWNSFDQYVNTQTYKAANGTVVTTDMVREIYTAPFTAIFHYYPSVGNKMFKPYIGVGLGAQYAEQNVYFNVYELDNNNWGFVFRPEIGTLIKFERTWGVLVTFSYNYATNKNSDFNLNSLQQFGINIGIAGIF